MLTTTLEFNFSLADAEECEDFFINRYSTGLNNFTLAWWDVPSLLSDPLALAERMNTPHLAPALELAQESLKLLTTQRPFDSTIPLISATELTPPAALIRLSRILGAFGAIVFDQKIDLNSPQSMAKFKFFVDDQFAKRKECDDQHVFWSLRDNADFFASIALTQIDLLIEAAWHGTTPDSLRLLINIGRLIESAQQNILYRVYQDVGVNGKAAKLAQQRANSNAAALGKKDKAKRERLSCQPLAKKILAQAASGATKGELMEELQRAMKAESLHDENIPKRRAKKFLHEVFESLGEPWGSRE